MDLQGVGCDMHRIHQARDKDQWWALANRLNASQERLGSLVHSVNQIESRGDAGRVYDTVSLSEHTKTPCPEWDSNLEVLE
jgi:hypothetical protein